MIRGAAATWCVVALVGLAGCSSRRATTAAAPSAGKVGGGGATSTAGARDATSTPFAPDALDACKRPVTDGLAARMLEAPAIVEGVRGPSTVSRSTCTLRSETTVIRIALFPKEQLARVQATTTDGATCAALPNASDFPEGCKESKTRGILAALDEGVAFQIVAARVSGGTNVTGPTDVEGAITSTAVDPDKTRRSAAVFLGLV